MPRSASSTPRTWRRRWAELGGSRCGGPALPCPHSLLPSPGKIRQDLWQLQGDVHCGLLSVTVRTAPRPGPPAGLQVGAQAQPPGWGARGAVPGVWAQALTAAPHLHSKLHCMRNYIHMNLFASFILKGVSVLVIDALLKTHYSDKIDDYNVHIWLSDEVSGRDGGDGGVGGVAVLTLVYRQPRAAGRPRSSCSTASWPTTAGCWWKASTCTTSWWWPSSPRGATSLSTCASAGVSAGGLAPRPPALSPVVPHLPPARLPSRGAHAVPHPLGRREVPLRKHPVSISPCSGQ